MLLKLSKALEASVSELLEDFTPAVVKRLRLEQRATSCLYFVMTMLSRILTKSLLDSS
jgi:hypothetical protein